MALLVHLFRRLPAILLLYKKFIPAIHSIPEALFTGWFGPMGVGSIFYCAVAVETIENSDNGFIFSESVAHSIEPIVYFIVLSSIIMHGLSIPVLQSAKYTMKILKCSGGDPSFSRDLERAPVSSSYKLFAYI